MSGSTRWLAAGLALAGLLAVNACGGDDAKLRATVITGSGDITGKVQQFRNLLGTDNGGSPTAHPQGRREINWDKVPDRLAAPNALPSDFFNARQEPRGRGAVLETPGQNVAVSADRDNPADAAPRFGNVNPGYAGQFKTFSKERLFSPIGSNVVDLKFFVPGTNTPGVVRGFGAVYTDIDKVENTAFEYFDADGKSLGKFDAPVSPAGLSFLGVAFPRPVVARVRIKYGNGKLGPRETKDYDVAVMDDFIYGEPQARAGY